MSQEDESERINEVKALDSILNHDFETNEEGPMQKKIFEFQEIQSEDEFKIVTFKGKLEAKVRLERDVNVFYKWTNENGDLRK